MEIAGLARTDRAGWGSEFNEVVAAILGTGGDEPTRTGAGGDLDEPDL